MNDNGLDLVALSSRIFRSRDRGVTWSEAVKGLPPKSISAITMRPGSPPEVYAWIYPEGIYRSGDGGESWSLVGDIPQYNDPLGRTHLVADIELPGFLLRIAQEVTTSYRWLWVERSFDSGATWERTLYIPDAVPDGYYLARDSTNSGTFYFCCDGSGIESDPRVVLRTTDRGTSWQSIAVPTDPFAVAGSGDALFVASYSGGLWKASLDGGTPTWTSILAAALSDVVVDRSGERVYARGPSGPSDSLVFRSSDGGASWQSAQLGVSATDGPAAKLAIASSSPELLWFATDQGVMRSLDGGQTFDLGVTGLVNTDVAGILEDPLRAPSEERVLVASEGRLFRYLEDESSQWLQLHRAGDAATYYEPAADASDALLLYYSTFFQLYRSLDGGESWVLAKSLVDYSDYPQEVRLLDSPQPSEVTANTLYAAERIEPEGGPYVAHLARSLDRGDTWQRVSSPGPTICGGGWFHDFVDTPSGSWVMGCLDGIWTSVDGGTSWMQTFESENTYFVQDLEVDPNDGNHLLAAAGLTVLDSRDGGRSWTALGNLPWAWQVAISRTNPRRIAASGDGVFLSNDAGTSWQAANSGFTTLDIGIVDFVGERDTLYAAAAGGGLWLAQELENPDLAPCVEGPSTLCLADGRFRVEVTWSTTHGSDRGNAVPLADDSGSFWFFDSANLELIVKLLDGRAINGHFWVFFGALSDVAYTIHVTDTETGLRREYHNTEGEIASRGDIEAFPTGDQARGLVRADVGARDVDRGEDGHGARGSIVTPVDFTWTTPVVAGSTVLFSDVAPPPSTNVGRAATIRTWRFGDGSEPLSTLATQTRYVYPEPGTYAVALEVGGETTQKSLEVLPDPGPRTPQGGGNGEETPSTGTLRIAGVGDAFVADEVSLSATAKSCRPAKSGWSWSVDGGTILGATDRSNVRVTWSTTGSRTVTVANSSCAQAAPASHALTIRQRPETVEGCRSGPAFLCLLGGRFEVRVEWRNGAGGAAEDGRALALTADSGYFWFFDSENVEVLVKVLDGRLFNGAFWVFFGALSNVEYTVHVRDTETGAVRDYSNPAGEFRSFADTRAFDP